MPLNDGRPSKHSIMRACRPCRRQSSRPIPRASLVAIQTTPPHAAHDLKVPVVDPLQSGLVLRCCNRIVKQVNEDSVIAHTYLFVPTLALPTPLVDETQRMSLA